MNLPQKIHIISMQNKFFIYKLKETVCQYLPLQLYGSVHLQTKKT